MSGISGMDGQDRSGFIFVRLRSKGKKSVLSKKVLIPTNLTALKTACQTAFKTRKPIKVFYDTEEQIIRAVRELEPGTTIIASTDDPKDGDADFEIADDTSDGKQPQFDPHARLLFTHFPKPGKVPAAATPSCVIVGFPGALILDQTGLSGRRKKKQKRRRRGLETHQFEEEEEYVTAREKYFFDQSNLPIYGDDADSSETGAGSGGRPHRFQKKEKSKTRQESVRGLLGSLFKDASVFTKLAAAFTSLSEETQEFLGEAEPNESAQRQTWSALTAAVLKKQKFCDRIESLFLVHEIRECVTASIAKHRFIAGEQCSHQFNIGIIGPRKSGKSTLLQLYAEQVSLELMATGDWKHVFMFVCDLKDFVPFVHDFEGFYRLWIETLCEQIAVQRCAVAKWIPDIRRYFDSLVSSPITLQFSKCYIVAPAQRQINQDVIELGQQIRGAWEEGDLDWWFTCLLSLAINLPAVLGFRKSLFIIDNIDFAALTISGCGRFLGSEPCAFGEQVKYMVKQNDYIVACEDLESFYQMSAATDEEGVDLVKNTDFITTYGIANQASQHDPPLILELKGEIQPFVFRQEFCDGIPNYLLLWHDLNRLVDNIHKKSEQSDEQEDALYFAVAHAQALVDLIFVPTGGQPVKITAVRRATRKEQQQIDDEHTHRVEQMRNELASSRTTLTASDV